MYKKIVYLLIIVIFTNCSTKLTNEQCSQLLKAYKENNYFKLDNLMSKIKFSRRNPELLLYKAKLDNVFNKPEESSQLINILLKKFPKYFGDSISSDLYLMEAINAERSQDYINAYKNDSLLVAKYSHVLDSSDLKSCKNDKLEFRNLFFVPKMSIKKISDSKISLKRDKVGLFNIPVTINNDSIDFVFDTGAGVSVICKSLATKYGMKILGNKVKVGSSTGGYIEAEVGLLDIKIGEIEIKNAIFHIFPDSSLSFAVASYAMKGVIGFPIMYALKEFTIKDDKFLIVGKKAEKSNGRNFALNGVVPVIRVVYKNDTLPFNFDTGANRTELYSSFFKKYKDEIIGHCKKRIRTFGGANGIIKSEVYMLNSAILSAGNSQCKVDSLVISAKDVTGSDVKYVYGNFGQDYIKKFSEMKINFASMNISFTN